MKNQTIIKPKMSPKIKFLFTDIDDTLTDQGRLGPEAYLSLWSAFNAGIKVIPVTGRPAGWCELIARQWPVDAVIGENGAFYFSVKNNKMKRSFSVPPSQIKNNKKKLVLIKQNIIKLFPKIKVSSDQFVRLFDLAIDIAEEANPALNESEINQILDLFHAAGAHAKASSIHINGWYGDYNKLTATLRFLKNEYQLEGQSVIDQCAFIGDSPNDEPMWAHFKNSFGVANIKRFLPQLKTPPSFITKERGGLGFTEAVTQLLHNFKAT